MTKDEAIATLKEALTRLRNECDLDGLRAKAGFDCWLSNADKALLAAATTAPSSKPVHFFRQKGEAVWIECATDPRETLASSPAADCFEYRTLYAETSAVPAVVVPEGWKLVPERVTYKMKRAGGAFQRSPPWVVYEAMLDAAPAAPLNTAAPTEGE